MKFETGKVKMNKINLCRELSYKVQDKGEQFSCVRPLGNRQFPRFHLFIEEDDKLKFKLHLDQKKASYGEESLELPARPNAHSGEYDSKRVEEEAERIKEIVESI